MSWKIENVENIKQECLNKDNCSSLFDVRDIKMEKESRSSIIKNNGENPDQTSKIFKNRKKNEKSDAKNSRIKGRFFDDDDDDDDNDHSHVDQDVVSKSETLIWKNKERKDLYNDNEELNQRIRKNNRKRKKDTDHIVDYRSSQDSTDSEEMSKKQQQKRTEEINFERKKKRVQILSDESDEDVNENLVKLEPSEKQQPTKMERIIEQRKKMLQISSDEIDDKLQDDNKEENQDKHKNREKALDNNVENPPKEIVNKIYNRRKRITEKFDKEKNNFEKLPQEIEEQNLDKSRSSNNNSDSESDEESVAREENLDEHKKKNLTPEMDKDVLRTLIVKLIHKVPEQHLLESFAGSHAPSPEIIRRFQKFVELKKGTYTPEEDRIINKNWKQFCKLHDWDTENYQPLLNWKLNSKFIVRNVNERKRFVQFLANGLPNRTLYSVYHRFKNLHAEHLQSRYTHEEDEAIINYIEDNSNSDNQTHVFADLAKILNRTRASVWRRYRLLKKKAYDE